LYEGIDYIIQEEILRVKRGGSPSLYAFLVPRNRIGKNPTYADAVSALHDAAAYANAIA